MARIFVLHIALVCFTVPGFSQGLFDAKYDDCEGGAACLYCGDTAAHYTKKPGEYISWQVNHSFNNSRYKFKNFDVLYEVYVDSLARTCVISSKSIGVSWSLMLQDDVRRFLNNMPDWKPAMKNGAPINSTVIIECKFRDNFLWVSYVKEPPKK